jgi:aminoglycoside phosphotransferase (APT) family kinase protein
MPSDVAAARETVVHRAVVEQGYPAPAIRLAGTRGAGLGGPFLLMDFAPGSPLLADLDGPAALRRLPSVLRTMPRTLAEAMAMLHDLEVEPIRTALTHAELRGPFEIDGLLTHLLDAAWSTDDADLHATAAWLEENHVPSETTVLCHGDLHPFNVMADPPAWCVLDWTAAVLADPAYDVAYTRFLVGNPPLHAPPMLRPLVAAGGRRLAKQFTRAYVAYSGRVVDPASLEWHTALHALRYALDLDTWRREGSISAHAGHPLVIIEPTIRSILTDHRARHATVR